jgi:hypothetical protein
MISLSTRSHHFCVFALFRCSPIYHRFMDKLQKNNQLANEYDLGMPLDFTVLSKGFSLITFLFSLQACAPRYVFHTLNPRKVERVEPVGTCYIAKNNFQSYSEYSPCRTSKCQIFSHTHNALSKHITKTLSIVNQRECCAGSLLPNVTCQPHLVKCISYLQNVDYSV